MKRQKSEIVVALVSGGKDSCLALEMAKEQGYNISYLVTVRPTRQDSYMFHTPALNIVPLLAEAVGLPLVTIKTLGEPETEVMDLERELRQLSPTVLIGGAVGSLYQYNRLEKVCTHLHCRGLFPLWQMPPTTVLKTILQRQYEVIFTGVSAMGLDETWLGKLLDNETVDILTELQSLYGVNPVGEGGEFETLVLNAPFFHARIIIDECEKKWDGSAGQLIIKTAHLEPKTN